MSRQSAKKPSYPSTPPKYMLSPRCSGLTWKFFCRCKNTCNDYYFRHSRLASFLNFSISTSIYFKHARTITAILRYFNTAPIESRDLKCLRARRELERPRVLTSYNRMDWTRALCLDYRDWTRKLMMSDLLIARDR